MRSVEYYDAGRNIWTPSTELNCRRSGAGVGVIEDRLYVVGGWDGSVHHESCEVFDPKTGRWAFIAPMLTARRNPGKKF
jgi:hypothetical protein